MSGQNPYADKARQRKVFAVAGLIDCKAVESGLNPHLAEVAARIVEQLESAPQEKWTGLAQEAGQHALSPDSRLALVNIYRQRAGMTAATVPPAALPTPRPPPPDLGKCRCGAVRDDPTDQMCRKCQVNELMEGQREMRKAEAEGLRP